MGYQSIQGVKIKPISTRFANWADGEAFGGWIYDCSVNIGFSKSPTSIDISIALDTQTSPSLTNPVSYDFDIKKSDLFLNNIGNDSHYDITIGGTEYKYMYPVSYKISAGSDSKTLSVKFIDYSVILDKITINLFKKGGYDKNKIKQFKISPKLSTYCQSCDLESSDFNKAVINGSVDSVTRGSFIFYNHANRAGIDLFPNLPNQSAGVVYLQNGTLTATKPTTGNYFSFLNYVLNPPSYSDFKNNEINNAFNTLISSADINGGSLTIGIEEWSDKICDNDSKTTYNFSELLACLRRVGFKFSKVNKEDDLSSYADVYGFLDKNINYRKDYVGSLREVLTQWCADFGLDFYFSGKTLRFVDLSAISSTALRQDIDEIKKIVYPNKVGLGQNFNSDKQFAISNWSESADLEDTYAKSLVTFNRRNYQVRTSSKKSDRAWDFQTLHPLEFLVNSQSAGMYDSRFLNDIDTCAALIRYSENIRNIYASNIISANPNIIGNYRAFAFYPIAVLDDQNEIALKSELIKNIIKDKKTANNKNTYEIVNEHFDVVIGFHNPEEFSKIKNWERSLGDNMYKYAIGKFAKNSSYDSPLFSSRIDFKSQPDSELFFAANNGKIDLSEIFQRNNINENSSTLYGKRIGIINENSWYPSSQEFENEIKNIMSRANGNKGCAGLFGSKGVNQFVAAESKNHNQNIDIEDWSPKIAVLSDDLVLRSKDWIQAAIDNNAYGGADILKAFNKILINEPADASSPNPYNCPSLYYLFIPRVSWHLGKNRNPHFVLKFNRVNTVNTAMAQNERKKFEDKVLSESQSLPKDECSLNINDRICENNGHHPCYTSEIQNREIGFDSFGCRGISIEFHINQFYDGPFNRDRYENIVTPGSVVPNINLGNKTYPAYVQFRFAAPTIQYPVYGIYRGVGTFNINTLKRVPEIIEANGSYWTETSNVRKVEHINNEIPQELQAQIDLSSQSQQFFNPYFDLNDNLIRTVGDYHNTISNLTRFSGPEYSENIEFSIVGDPALIPNLAPYLKPHRGLKSLSFKLGSEGFSADLQFSNAPPEMPKNEAILNKIIQKL
jgi:hypothetical protein